MLAPVKSLWTNVWPALANALEIIKYFVVGANLWSAYAFTNFVIVVVVRICTCIFKSLATTRFYVPVSIDLSSVHSNACTSIWIGDRIWQTDASSCRLVKETVLRIRWEAGSRAVLLYEKALAGIEVKILKRSAVLH